MFLDDNEEYLAMRKRQAISIVKTASPCEIANAVRALKPGETINYLISTTLQPFSLTHEEIEDIREAWVKTVAKANTTCP